MKRRIRVKYLWYKTRGSARWGAFYEPPGRVVCYCEAYTLAEMWVKLAEYFGAP